MFFWDAPLAPLAAARDLDDFYDVAIGRGEPGAVAELDGECRRLRLDR